MKRQLLTLTAALLLAACVTAKVPLLAKVQPLAVCQSSNTAHAEDAKESKMAIMEVGPFRRVVSRVLLLTSVVLNSETIFRWAYKVGRGVSIWW